MTIETDNEVSITIEFDKAVQAIAYLSDLIDHIESFDNRDFDRTASHIRTAKEICEAFVCEHFQDELGDE